MKTKESKGFFCVVYFTDTKRTCYYHKVWNPKKLALSINNWLWIKSYVSSQDYYSNPKGNNYYAIFDAQNAIRDFTFQKFTKKIL